VRKRVRERARPKRKCKYIRCRYIKECTRQPSKGLSLEKQEKETKMEKDPVCGMTVDPEKTQWTLEHEGRKYYFCREGCMKAFARGSERFIRAA
jgi:Cu+-exporting ATPase